MQKKSSADSSADGSPPPLPADGDRNALHPDHPRLRKVRTPEAFGGLQVNFCKNPRCNNYGIPIGKKARRKDGERNLYRIAAHGKGLPVGLCHGCQESFPLKSNRGIHEELSRMMRALEPSKPPACCPNEACANHATPVSQGKAFYSAFGVTSTGSQRYRCKACQKTFSVNTRAISRQRVAHKNKTIFKLLVNKSPIRRIAEIAGVDVKTVYAKIDFIHRQCMAFAQSREAQLPEKSFRRLYVSVDRQDYVINWVRREDKRNTVVSAVASADSSAPSPKCCTPAQLTIPSSWP